MNRVVLCGRLTSRPRSSYTPTGVAVANFNLLVSQVGMDEAALVIPCLALRELAQELNEWGERGHRVNLEGHLHCSSPSTNGRQGSEWFSVKVESAYFVDPVKDPYLRSQGSEPADEESRLAEGSP